MQSHYAIAQRSLIVETRRPQISLFVSPNAEEQKHLLSTNAISEHNLHAILHPNSLPRVEFEFSHIALIMKFPCDVNGGKMQNFSLASIGFFLYESQLLIVIKEPFPILEHLRLGDITAPASILIHLVGKISQLFTEKLSEMIMLYEELENSLATTQDNKYMLDLFLLEKQLVYFVNALHGNSMVLEKFSSIAKKFVTNHEDIADLGEVTIENNQCLRLAEIHSGLLSSLVAARLSIVSNNLSILMKNLNLITIGIMVPTFIVSVFSMNVKIPFQQDDYAFDLVIILASIAAIIFLVCWKFISNRNNMYSRK